MDFKGVMDVMIWICILSALQITTANQTETANALIYNQHYMLGNKIDYACMNFTFPAMEFYSPNYPANYPNDIECVRSIEAQPGFEIHLDFREKFELEVDQSKECRYDFLEVRDGPFGYSRLFDKFCGKNFPPLLISATRYMWLRFVSDKNSNYGGFKGVYSFFKKKDYKPELEESNACRIPISKSTTGILSSAPMKTLLNGNVDCTWEIQAPPQSKIHLSDFKVAWKLQLSSPCDSTRLEFYKTSTSKSDLVHTYCLGSIPDITIDSSLAFIRVFSPAFSLKPDVEFTYTVLNGSNKQSFINKPQEPVICTSNQFVCDKSCLPKTLLCDGNKNCPSGFDESNCSSKTDIEVPLYIIVAGSVGGLIVTIVIIGICVACLCKRNRKRKESEFAEQQEKLKDSSIEMSTNSTSTTLTSKKGANQVEYFSLPRPHTGKGGNYKDGNHRNSLTNSLQTPSEGEYGDHSSDPGTYKKFLVLDQYIEDESSPCQSLYNQGPVLTTIIERHDVPPQTEIDGSYGWTGYGWKQQQGDVRSPSSLSENLARLARYNLPQQQQKSFQYNPDGKLYSPDQKFDMYPDQKVLMGKEYKVKYSTPGEKDINDEHNVQKQFKISSQHPDITRDLEVK